MGLAVNVVCRNWQEDRVIPRFSRYLRDYLGWELTARPNYEADVIYLSGYFEAQLMKPWPTNRPVAAYLTHIETQPPGNGKAKLFMRVAKQVDLRIVTAAMYGAAVVDYGPTAQITAPVERERFTLTAGPSPKGRGGIVAGFSGFSYSNGRKGEGLARALVASPAGRKVTWMASGRGWPVKTRKYRWSEMPGFYQGLDILVVTSLVEGIPMPPLEVLSCGGSIVIPKGVGLFDELPKVAGIHRYRRGNVKDAQRALAEAVEMRPSVNRKALRAVTDPFTIGAWCEQHRAAFEELFL
jgi:hypothetical protein